MLSVFLCGSTYLTGQEITMESKPDNLLSAIEELESSYGLLFSYAPEDIGDCVVDVESTYESLVQLCKELFAQCGLVAEMYEGNYVVLTPLNRNNSICSRIVDAESGTPLVYATVMILRLATGEVTDEDGNFCLEGDFADNDSLVVSYVGYDDAIVLIGDIISENISSIPLSVPKRYVPWLVIEDYITDGVSLTDNGLKTKVDPQRVGGLPGSVEPDILKTIQFLPGVSNLSSRTSDIYIRGGTPDQNLILWEDIPIYHSAHYFGMISAIDPLIVKDMEVYRGGFGSEYGGRISGVIDIHTTDETLRDSKIGAGSNFTHAYLYGHKAFGDKRHSSIAYSFRRSIADVWQSPTFNNITLVNQQEFIIGNKEVESIPDRAINIQNDFEFVDSHVKLASKISDRDRIEISGLFATNDFRDIIIDRPTDDQQFDTIRLNNKGLSVRWEHLWRPNLETHFKLVGTAFDYTYNYRLEDTKSGDYKVVGLKTNTIVDQQLHIDNYWQLSPESKLDFGYQLIHYDIAFEVNEITQHQLVSDPQMTSSNVHAIYGSYGYYPSDKLGIDIGMRVNYLDASEDYYIEPRIGLRYQLLDGLSLLGNYGIYNQYVGQVVRFRGNDNGFVFPLWALAENMSIPVQEAKLQEKMSRV